MKCVKINETEEIRRVTDEKAEQLVKDGKATFAKKTDWKAAGRLR